MNNEALILILTTISIAFFHTLAGPDHYLPFLVIAKARNWSFRKTIWFTALCGVGHVGSSVILGIVGVALGIAVGKIELWEEQRGSIIAILLLAFGFLYTIWGIYRSIHNKSHTHRHIHSDMQYHEHEHTHDLNHKHIHDSSLKSGKINITPWILFTIFIFGPCEPLIPLVMYPAAQSNTLLLIIVTILFTVVTIGTMVVMVGLAHRGFNFIPLKKFEKHNHTIAGLTILLCGVGMVFFGL